MGSANRILKAAATAVLLAGTAALVAGPLTPPAGAPAPTFRTLSEVQPATPVQSLPGSTQAMHVITQPGSYYLTGPITATAGSDGILVLADSVTIDLGGFALDGAGNGHDAIAAGDFQSPIKGLTVRNGAIGNWAGSGIVADPSGCLYEDLRFHEVRNTALHSGPSLIRNCIVIGGGAGFNVESGSRIVDCSATGCAYTAFGLGAGCAATRCGAYDCHRGFDVYGDNCSMTDCVVRGGDIGVDLYGGGCRVQGCKIGQALVGIACESGNTIVGNTLNAPAGGEGWGISVHQGANHLQDNHLYAFQEGISITSTSTTNVVVSNTMHSCTLPINLNGATHPMCAPIVNSAAALATNPVANIAQ